MTDRDFETAKRFTYRFTTTGTQGGNIVPLVKGDGSRRLIRFSMYTQSAATSANQSAYIWTSDNNSNYRIGAVNVFCPWFELDFTRHGNLVCQAFTMTGDDGTAGGQLLCTEILDHMGNILDVD